MTHDEHAHAHTPVAEFSDAEWGRLKTEDASGARAVVGLMVGIFTVGLILYLIVALSTGT